jgi:hypothetical protein
MRVGLWISALVALLPAAARAQEKPADPAPPTGGFFRDKRVSFWGDVPLERAVSSREEKTESLWAEPIRLPDGRMTIYVPPKQVLAFLETPSEESGKAYLAWQKERMEKLARASEILARLSGRLAQEAKLPVSPLPDPPAEKKDSAPATLTAAALSAKGADQLLYFKREGCPHCKHEDPEIAALLAERPGLKVKVLMPGDEPELWKAYGVEVVPTMIVIRADGKKMGARGYTPKATLIRAFAATEGDPK